MKCHPAIDVLRICSSRRVLFSLSCSINNDVVNWCAVTLYSFSKFIIIVHFIQQSSLWYAALATIMCIRCALKVYGWNCAILHWCERDVRESVDCGVEGCYRRTFSLFLMSASVFSHAIFFCYDETLIITDHITHHRHNGRINDTTTMLPSGLFSSLSIDLFLCFSSSSA